MDLRPSPEPKLGRDRRHVAIDDARSDPNPDPDAGAQRRTDTVALGLG